MTGSHAETSKASAGKRGRKAAMLLLAAAALLAALAVAATFAKCSAPADDGMEPNVVVGTMEGYSDEELAAMLAKKVDEGMIAFSLNTSMLVEGLGSQTSIKFENPPNNAKLTKLELVLDETGERIYQTGYLAPGSYVDADELDVQLPAGVHTCTAYISSYDQETKKYLGEAACAVTVTVTE